MEGRGMDETSTVDGDLEQRQASLDEISSFISSCTDNLQTILNDIGWTDEILQDGASMVTCPVNPNHSIPESSLKAHRERCEWTTDGYTRKEQEKSVAAQGNQFFYQNAKGVSSITLDPEQEQELLMRISGKAAGSLPRTMDRLEIDFSPEQRLAMHEWVRDQLKAKRLREEGQTDQDLDFPLDLDAKKEKDDEAGKGKSHAEVLAEMRDYRRRRQSYRAKNVHITKRSKTDVMREIIDAHMKFLEETSKPSPEEERQGREKDLEMSKSRDGRGHRRSRSRDRIASSDVRSRSGSRSRDSTPHGHRHRSKHKHKHKHKSKSKRESRYDDD